MAHRVRACGEPLFRQRQRLQAGCDVLDVLTGQFVRDHLHDAAFLPLVGAQEHDGLLDEVVGVLAGRGKVT